MTAQNNNPETMSEADPLGLAGGYERIATPFTAGKVYLWHFEEYGEGSVQYFNPGHGAGFWNEVKEGDPNGMAVSVLTPDIWAMAWAYARNHGQRTNKYYGDDMEPMYRVLLPPPYKVRSFLEGPRDMAEGTNYTEAAVVSRGLLYGNLGEFAARIGEALVYADLDNEAAIRAAFPALWNKGYKAGLRYIRGD